MNEHIAANFKYPEEAQKQGIQGKVYINFRIGKNGEVTVINHRAPHPSLAEECIRLIESLPQLTPAKMKTATQYP